MSLDLRDLRWAIVAAQHRSLRQAPDKLHIRQSTLSRRLRDLEHQLGAALLERSNGGTRPTIEGQEFLRICPADRRGDRGDHNALQDSHARRKRPTYYRGARVPSAGNLRATLIERETVLLDGSGVHLACDLASSAIDVAFMISASRQWERCLRPGFGSLTKCISRRRSSISRRDRRAVFCSAERRAARSRSGNCELSRLLAGTTPLMGKTILLRFAMPT